MSSKVIELGWGERLGSDMRLLLHGMPGKAFSEKVTFEDRLKGVSQSDIQRKNSLGQKNSKCKGPEDGMSLVCLVSGEHTRGRTRGYEAGEAGKTRSCRLWHGI